MPTSLSNQTIELLIVEMGPEARQEALKGFGAKRTGELTPIEKRSMAMITLGRYCQGKFDADSNMMKGLEQVIAQDAAALQYCSSLLFKRISTSMGKQPALSEEIANHPIVKQLNRLQSLEKEHQQKSTALTN